MSENEMKLPELFFETERLLRMYENANMRRLNGMDPRQGQGRVLTLLKKVPEISQKELGYLLDMRLQSMGEVLRKLEAAGYITRQPDEKDRRVMMIHLTDKGREADIAGRDLSAAFSCLTEEEKENMMQYLNKLREHLSPAVLAADGDDGERRPYRSAYPHGPMDFGPGRPPMGGPHGHEGFGPGCSPMGGPHGPEGFGPGCSPMGGPHGPEGFGPGRPPMGGPHSPEGFGPGRTPMGGPYAPEGFGPGRPPMGGPHGHECFGADPDRFVDGLDGHFEEEDHGCGSSAGLPDRE